jgi:hypothetical protein
MGASVFGDSSAAGGSWEKDIYLLCYSVIERMDGAWVLTYGGPELGRRNDN